MVFYERHCVLSHERQCVPLLGARFVLVKWPPSRSVGRQRSLATGRGAGEGEVLQRVAPREKVRLTEIPRAMSATPLKHSLKTPWCSLPSPRSLHIDRTLSEERSVSLRSQLARSTPP